MTASVVEIEAAQEELPGDLTARRLWHAIFSSSGAICGAVIVAILVLSAVLAPVIAPTDPTAQQLTDRMHGPSAAHWFGTDAFGRDILSRVIYGGRISLLVGFGSVLVALIIGVTLGITAGYFGGWYSAIVMRVMDAFYAFPAVLLAIGILGALGPGLQNVIIAVGVTSVPVFARISRGAVLQVRELEYISAAKSLALGRLVILWRHVLPNSMSPVIVVGTLQIASAILAASSLSFLGLGVQPPTAEWGSMLADGRNYITTAPWLSIFPGLAIMLAVMGFNLLGDALRDAHDPNLR